MWMVWSESDGLCGIFDKKEEALKEYERQKLWYEDNFDGEFCDDEHVVLAKVERNFYCHDTKEPVIDCDDEGNEFEKDDETYWDWKEDIC